MSPDPLDPAHTRIRPSRRDHVTQLMRFFAVLGFALAGFLVPLVVTALCFDWFGPDTTNTSDMDVGFGAVIIGGLLGVIGFGVAGFFGIRWFRRHTPTVSQ